MAIKSSFSFIFLFYTLARVDHWSQNLSRLSALRQRFLWMLWYLLAIQTNILTCHQLPALALSGREEAGGQNKQNLKHFVSVWTLSIESVYFAAAAQCWPVRAVPASHGLKVNDLARNKLRWHFAKKFSLWPPVYWCLWHWLSPCCSHVMPMTPDLLVVSLVATLPACLPRTPRKLPLTPSTTNQSARSRSLRRKCRRLHSSCRILVSKLDTFDNTFCLTNWKLIKR